MEYKISCKTELIFRFDLEDIILIEQSQYSGGCFG